jgi:DNA-binding NarL/FixJ family response regulator
MKGEVTDHHPADDGSAPQAETVTARNGSPAARLLLVDDHALLRAGIRSMLSHEPDLEVVGEAGDGREAVELCHTLRPDLVLMDVSMPGVDGITATRKIKADLPHVGVLVLTAHDDHDLLLEAVRAGAAGYVLKGVGPAELVGAVRATLVGETPVDQELVMRLVRRLAGEEGKKPPTVDRREPERGPLTARELEVLALLTTGKTNRQIAQELHLSLSTVKRNLERIISKLGVSDRTQAAVKAVELGLTDPGRAG